MIKVADNIKVHAKSSCSVTSSCDQRNVGIFWKNSFKTDVALEHGLAKYLSAEIIARQQEKCPAKREREKTRVKAGTGQKGSKSTNIHGVCLLKHGLAGLTRKAA